MKRWLYSLFFAIGVVMLLWIAHHPVHSPVYPQDRSLLSRRELVFTAPSPALSRSRLGPGEFFAIEFALNTDIAVEEGPPWLDYRGPPGPNACRHDFAHSLQGCRPGWQPQGSDSPAEFWPSGGRIRKIRFCNSL